MLLIIMGIDACGMEFNVWIIYVKMHLHHIQLMNSVKVYIKFVLRMEMVVYLIMVVSMHLLSSIVTKIVKIMNVYGEVIIVQENNVNMLETIILDMNNVNLLCFYVLKK